MTGRIPTVVVIGSAYVDMAVRCNQVPQLGKTAIGSGFSCTPTGAGLNQAIQTALCGCRTYLISKVGNDLFAQMIKDNLAEFGVSTDFVCTAEAKNTGTIVTFCTAQGENCSCLSPGANRALTPEDITSEKFEEIIASADVCLIHAELPRQTTIAAIRTANLHRTKVIVDPAAALEKPDQLNGDLETVDEEKRVCQPLPIEYFSADILIPDVHEASEITEEPINSIHTAKLIGSDIVARGVQCAVIKMGKRGCVVIDRQGTEHIPAFEVNFVDQTCAGDAFAGALAACCAVGDDIRKAVRFASAAGALACTKFGAQDSLPKKEEIIELLQKHSD